jgi:hypothetical protein
LTASQVGLSSINKEEEEEEEEKKKKKKKKAFVRDRK